MQLFRRIHQLDEAAFARISRADSKFLDVTMPALTRAADYSRLWFAIAAIMRVAGNRRTKRAAARGVATVAVSSLITNQGLKRLHRRMRPNRELVPLRRLGRRHPTSSSFPSGHSASAAAFATSVGMENLPLGAALGVLAGGVGLSRVATGAHYPSDVIVGLGVGAGVAVLGRKIVPPVAPVLTDDYRPDQIDVPAISDGSGLAIIVNEKSGPDGSEQLLAAVREQLPNARIITLEEDDDLHELAKSAAQDATVLGVSGGDGTVVAVAQVAMERGLPLAVFPGGTFNHFAKDARINTIDEAVEAVKGGKAMRVDVAMLNDRIFLNTASVGSYPEFVTEREKLQPRYGKRLAALIAAYRLLKETPRTHLRVDGEHVTSMLFFVGNGKYLPDDFAPAMRPSLDDGLLDVRILRSGGAWSSTRLMWATLTGTLQSSKIYQQMSVPQLDVEVLESEILLSRDGEVDDPERHLHFRVKPKALTVYQPENPGM